MSSVCDGKSNVITDGTSASSSKSRGSDMGFSLNLGIEKGHTENLEKSHQKGIFEREKPAAPQDATSGAGRAVAEEKKINWKKTGEIAAGGSLRLSTRTRSSGCGESRADFDESSQCSGTGQRRSY